MGDLLRKIDMEKLISYSNNLVELLKYKRDINSLTQYLYLSKSLQSSCDADLNLVLNSIQDYQKKIEACKQKTEWAKSEVAVEAEVDHLQSELEELKKELHSRRSADNYHNEINDLEHQWIAIEEWKRTHPQEI